MLSDDPRPNSLGSCNFSDDNGERRKRTGEQREGSIDFAIRRA
jgi:hypothetical protein